MAKHLAEDALRQLQDASKTPQDASRTAPRGLQDGSKTASNRFEIEPASYLAFETPKKL